MNKINYSLGCASASHLLQAGVTLTEFEDFLQGFKDAMSGRLKFSPEEINSTIQNFFEQKRKAEEEQGKTLGSKFQTEYLTKEGVRKTESGLLYRVISAGTGKTPGPHSQVEVNYEGKFIDGKKFDSSYDRGQTTKFGLDSVISGWTEGLQLMQEGAKYEFVIPYDLAYGPQGMPGAIPPYSTLVFTVELVKVL